MVTCPHCGHEPPAGSAFIAVIELDGDGRALRMDIYDPHHHDQALARFAELAAHDA